MPAGLTVAQIKRAARDHDLPPAALQAFVRVESSGSGFLPDGRVRILLDGSLLWRRLQAKGVNPIPLATYYPNLCHQTWTRKYYLGGAQEWDRVEKVLGFAAQVNAESSRPVFGKYEQALYEACAWGMFALLGQNHQAAGYIDVYALKDDQERGESQQLKAILRWMEENGLVARLRAKDWREFARGYNGVSQADRYAERLAGAYLALGGQRPI